MVHTRAIPQEESKGKQQGREKGTNKRKGGTGLDDGVHAQ